MSWLYSIVFAGLLFSSNGDLPVPETDSHTDYKFANIVLAEETERFEQTYPLNANGRVSLSNVNGSVTVETWDRNEVKLSYVKTADTKENLDDVRVIIEARKDSFQVGTEYGAIKNRTNKSYNRLDVEYRITVPRNAVINKIETVNGSISITGAGNMTKASAVNGEVRAVNLRGTANLSTVNGTIVADFNELQTGGKISLNTVNGTVDLIIPSDANATIKADTVNGRITNDFGLPVRKGEYVGSDLYGKVGSGDVQIRLNSVNGTLSVRRKNDRKKLNPATNLLNMKSEDDDEDWDDEDADNDSRVKPPKPPKPTKPTKPTNPSKPPKPPKPPIVDSEAINRLVEEALREASKELEKINPELRKIYLADLENQLREVGTMINAKEMQEQIKEAKERYREALVELASLNWTTGSPVIEKTSDTFNMKGTPNVTVAAKNCRVSVRGWDKSEVSYSLVKMSRDIQKPAERSSTVSIKNTDSEVDIRVSSETTSTGGAKTDEWTKTHIEIYVPRKSNLKIVSNQEIRLEGVSGTVDLRGESGAVNVRDGDGLLTINTTEARIRVIGFRGDLESRTRNGSMFLDGGLKRLLAETDNGEIVLTLPENENATISANKSIRVENIDLTDAGDKKWRIGKGTANYFLRASYGQIFIRSESALKSNEIM